MTIAGLSHRALGPGSSGGVFGGYQTQMSAHATTGQPRPVANLTGKPERSLGSDPAHTAQTADNRRELAVGGHRGDRLIEAVAPVQTRQQRIKGAVIDQLQRPCCRNAARATKAHAVATRHSRRSRRSLGAKAVSIIDAGHSSSLHGNLRAPGPDRGLPPGPPWAPLLPRSGPGAVTWQNAGHHGHQFSPDPQPGEPASKARPPRSRCLQPQRSGQPEPGRAGLIRRRNWLRQSPNPFQDVLVIRRQPALKHLPGFPVQPARHHRPCVHIQTNTRALTIHWAPHIYGSTGQDPSP
ncbi:hypothetical protein MHEC_08030 [Mycobacterium heckeshornense]|uniref:Uncharacterized protein n=1 Tax=Mycobacterium heckeshornense TaxID=110505 RepID=A0A7R7JG07_9MYCO|nr:hypothetical protein MHEC_08030 [Mycobacterium heckeshornense]